MRFFFEGQHILIILEDIDSKMKEIEAIDRKKLKYD